MPLDHKINIKWNLGFCTNLLESFSSGNQIPSWHQSKRWELLNRENLCKLDGLRTVAKLKGKFYMKGLLTIAWNTFLQWGRLFPTSVASFWATKPNDMRQTYVCSETASEQSGNLAVNRNKVTARHCGHLEAKVTRVYLSRETNWRSENSSQTSDFDFENLSSLQSFVSR